MTLAHTPLDVARMSPAAQKALGSPPGRMMASRGLVPLPPIEQISVLYQLAIDPDQNLATAARTTAMGLPDTLIAGALNNPQVDPRVLDLFAQLVGDNAGAFEALVGNATTGDATIAYLAANGGSREIDRIATNETRLLRHPEIIAAMYQNKHARMSTVDRVVELAVRNNIRVPGLAAWDEIARALQAHPTPPESYEEVDTLFSTAMEQAEQRELMAANDPAAAREKDDDENLPVNRLPIAAQIRACSTGGLYERAMLVRSPIKMVAMAAIKAPSVNESEVEAYARNPGLVEDVIKYIANRRDWLKGYDIKVSLCKNPKTPVADAMRLMQFLRDKDLADLSKSRGVTSAVVGQAKRLLTTRTGAGKK